MHAPYPPCPLVEASGVEVLAVAVLIHARNELAIHHLAGAGAGAGGVERVGK